MGTRRKASTLACAAVLALGAFAGATAPSAALAGPGASTSSYLSASKKPQTHAPRRSRRRSHARCARSGAHHWTHAGRRHTRGKHPKRGAAHAHARGTRCGERSHRRRRRRTHHHLRPHHHKGHPTHAHTHRSHRHSSRRTHAPSAGRSSSCANASITPGAENLDLVRAAVLCLINRERAGAGQRALTSVTSLSTSAQRHTEDMASADYFDHVGPRGDTPSERMRAAGYLAGAQFFEVGENIAYGTGWMATPRAIVAAWMASPGHRANILDPDFRDTGIGASAHLPASLSGGQRGAIYTEDFGVTSG